MCRKTWRYVIVSIALAGTLQACGGGSDGGGTAVATDTTPPTITAFTLPVTAASLTVSVSSFIAADNVLVTGYMITQSAALPDAGAAGWTATAPAIVTAAAAGSQTFVPWAKDGAGNVSAVAASQTVTINLDPTAPVVTAFTMPATAAGLSVSISAFTATDNVAVTGYMVTQSATPPVAGDVGWTATAPATVTSAGTGSQTFFPWAKDANGNVSAVVTPATVTMTPLVPPVSVPVSASGTDTTSAVGADATFTFAAVDGVIIVYNISGFGAGDKLVFPVFGGAPNALNTVNPSPTDGIVTFQLIRNVGGQKFDITVVLNGLSAAQDQQITDVATFNAVFGANSIQ
jgi:hypothetical protein